jgi:DNA-binding response OmpR family regulator
MRVLLLVQHHLLAQALRRGLEEEGMAVTVALDEEGESTAVGADHDLIILDLGTRSEGALPLIQGWRRRGVQAPVLVLTSGGGSADAARYSAALAVASLSKPFAWGSFLARTQALTGCGHQAGGLGVAVP